MSLPKNLLFHQAAVEMAADKRVHHLPAAWLERLELRGKYQYLTTRESGILRWNLSYVTLHLRLSHTVDVNLCTDR